MLSLYQLYAQVLALVPASECQCAVPSTTDPTTESTLRTLVTAEAQALALWGTAVDKKSKQFSNAVKLGLLKAPGHAIGKAQACYGGVPVWLAGSLPLPFVLGPSFGLGLSPGT